MIHGNGEDHTVFRESSEILKDHFICYLPDSRGHGMSGKPQQLHYKDIAEDVSSFIEALDLSDVVLYGFSDGGIAGLLAACENERITTLIVSGANLTPKGIKAFPRLLYGLGYLLSGDPVTGLMLHEPQIDDGVLKGIRSPTLVLSGSRDVIKEKETVHIAETVPDAKLRILSGETHGSYVVHSEKIANIIIDFVNSQSSHKATNK